MSPSDHCATTVAVFYSVIVTAMFVAAPELITFAPVWSLWVLVMVGSLATYAAGQRLWRRKDG